MPNRIYFMPVIAFDGGRRRPKWWQWYPNIVGAHPDANPNAIPLPSGPDPLPPGTNPGVGVMDYGIYGLQNFAICYARAITQAEHDFLALQSDIYIVPEDLDTAITDVQGTRDYFEAAQVPALWLTPSNTYREMIRQFGSIFQFSQRYAGMWAENLFALIDLDTALRDWPANVQTQFELTAADFGIDPGLIKPNNDLRQMLQGAGAAFAENVINIGGLII